MSTTHSPKQRARKLTGGRHRLSFQLPAAEMQALNKESDETGLSISSIVNRRYLLGKQAESQNHN